MPSEEEKKRGCDALSTKLAGQYSRIEFFGEGGLSLIYKAEVSQKDAPTETDAVTRIIKVLKLEKAPEKGTFNNERNILKELDHPAFPKHYKSDDLKINGHTLPYYISDYFNKGTIGTYFEAIPQGLARFQVFKSFFLQALSALDYLHGKRIFHLDLKATNSLINEPKRESPHLKIIDFGSAVDLKATMEDTITVITTKSNWPPEYHHLFKTDPSESLLRREVKDR